MSRSFSLFIFFAFGMGVAAGLTDVKLRFQNGPSVQPGHALVATIEASIEGEDGEDDFEARFQGDVVMWGSPPSTITRAGSQITFSITLTAPTREGLFEHVAWALKNTATGLTVYTVAGTVDVTCSDGVYCNGIERYVKSKCEASQAPPCLDPAGDICASYECIETNRSCARTPLGGPDCARCKPSPCSPSCKGVLCGDDGCGGSCGVCAVGEFCVEGACGVVEAVGSCARPELLQAPGIVDGVINPDLGTQLVFDVYGSNINGLDMTQGACQSAGIPEWVYGFTIPEGVKMGFEIRMTRDDGTNSLDTLLAIHDATCKPFAGFATDRLCSDDQTPPGNLASRVDGLLLPGSYTIIASAYASSTLGNFKLAVKFVKECVPKCEGKFCGSDDCGGTCGGCDDGLECRLGRCAPAGDSCVPDCHSAQCGSDGCGGLCGVCKNKRYCDMAEKVCVPIKPCDSFLPECHGTGSANHFCGTDCEWHHVTEPLPDLVPNGVEDVLASVEFQWLEFEGTSCAYQEGCVSGEGKRLLMRFDTRVHNIGTTDFIGPNIGKNPDLFTWADCHQHYHFDKFAKFNLYQLDGTLAVPGAKLSYCMEDAEQYATGSTVPCDTMFDCLNQGIPRGRTDNYAGSLDCQWLDITELSVPSEGLWMTYEVCTNIGRTIMEMSYDNNCQSWPMFIPSHVAEGTTLKYANALEQFNACGIPGAASFPGCA